uniref:Uncharacterized protein n=1 Tax=Oryza sativa subsp. japonica TaxID=39947 RepID=Q6H401_ORYSJ|nr:hypothetical protein [Oryza sativa Japonica Group]
MAHQRDKSSELGGGHGRRRAPTRAVDVGRLLVNNSRPVVIEVLGKVNLSGTGGNVSESSPGVFLQGLRFYTLLEHRVALVVFSQDDCYTTLDDNPLADFFLVDHEPKSAVGCLSRLPLTLRPRLRRLPIQGTTGLRLDRVRPPRSLLVIRPGGTGSLSGAPAAARPRHRRPQCRSPSTIHPGRPDDDVCCYFQVAPIDGWYRDYIDDVVVFLLKSALGEIRDSARSLLSASANTI